MQVSCAIHVNTIDGSKSEGWLAVVGNGSGSSRDASRLPTCTFPEGVYPRGSLDIEVHEVESERYDTS